MHCCRPQGISSDHAEQEDDGNGEVEAITEGIAALSSDGGEVAGRGRSEDDQLSGTIHSSSSTQRLTYCYFTSSG